MSLKTSPIRRFDAPDPPSRLADALATIGVHWRVAGAVLFVICCTLCGATALLLGDALWSSSIVASIDATRLYVVMEPNATQADVEALGSPLKAMSAVATATLESKDTALKALVAGGLVVPDGRNPLPDAWIVTLRSSAAMSDPRAFVEWVADARRASGELPHVEATRVDGPWIASVDRRLEAWRRLRTPLLIAGFGLSALLLAATGLLAASGFAGSPDTTATASIKLAPTFAILVIAAAAILVTGTGAAIAAQLANHRLPTDVQAVVLLSVRTDTWSFVALGCGALASVTIGAWAGATGKR